VDLKLKPFDFQQAVARAGLKPDGTPVAGGVRGLRPAANESVQEAQDFRTEMAAALKSVSRAQSESSRLQREVQLENSTVSLEETMIAMQKSQLGFQAVLQVRNRLVQAYSEVMNMQV
jgi:flagellar hook-basal body complex protein FliE